MHPDQTHAHHAVLAKSLAGHATWQAKKTASVTGAIEGLLERARALAGA